MWDRNHLSNMIEIDFFGASNHRSTSERERLIEEFEGASRDNSDFMNYGYDYYDNADYGVGYGGYHFDGRYAGSVANIISHYGLTPGSTVLELGCAKGFTLTEFLKRDMKICGVDISAYATDNALPEVRPYIIQGSSVGLCFGSDAFDLVYSKEMLPHLTEGQVRQAIAEAIRVCRTDNIFFEVQVANDEKARDLMKTWDETHQCLRSANWWREMFHETGFVGQVNFKSVF